MRNFLVAGALLAGLSCASGALAAEQTTAAAVRSFELSYGFNVKDVPSGAGKIEAWLPLPPSNSRQTVHSWELVQDYPWKVVSDAEYGNNFLWLDLSQATRDANGMIPVTVKINATRVAYRPIDQGMVYEGALSDTLMTRFTGPDSMIPLDGKISAEAEGVLGGTRGSATEIARKLYDHIVDTVLYDKSGPAGTWGRGDANFACDVRKGNCTDFHSLWIGEMRSQGIPARFFMGMSVPSDAPEGSIGGYHCWAEYFDPQYGWVPVDASDASKNGAARREELFGGLCEHRLEFVMGRDISIPGISTPQNFLIYPYIAVDGKKHEAYDKVFSYSNR
ncbi:transglutaminase domain-containing protein [bacterium]|nr:transglutaminase domain-containing protein [bacterium]